MKSKKNNNLKNVSKNNASKTNLTYLLMCPIFAAMIAVGAFIKIPMPLIPFSLQTFFTLLASFLMNRKYSPIPAAIYLFIGLMGIPIFTQGGGPGYVLLPSFGYLVGFIAGNYMGSSYLDRVWEKRTPNMREYIIAGIINIMTVYAVGLLYWFLLANVLTDNKIGLWTLLLNGFILTVAGDAIKCVAAAMVATRLKLAMRKIK